MFGDFGKMMKLAGQMKRRLPELQEKMAKAEYTAQAGPGAVSATVNGKLALVALRIDPKVLCDTDAALLADMIKAAVSAAQDQATAAAAEAMRELTGGMDLPGGLEGMF